MNAGLGDAAELVDLGGWEEHEERDGGCDVKGGDEGGGEPCGARHGAGGIADFATHHAGDFESADGVADAGPETEGAPVGLGDELCGADDGCGAVFAVGEDGHDDERNHEEPGGDAGDVFGPFADGDADQIEQEAEPDDGERCGDDVGAAVGEMLERGAESVGAHAHVGDGEGGEENGDSEPVGPEAEESVEGAEVVARPDVHAACAGVLYGECSDSDCERDEKED